MPNELETQEQWLAEPTLVNRLDNIVDLAKLQGQHALVAHLVERSTEDAKVGCSSHPEGIQKQELSFCVIQLWTSYSYALKSLTTGLLVLFFLLLMIFPNSKSNDTGSSNKTCGTTAHMIVISICKNFRVIVNKRLTAKTQL